MSMKWQLYFSFFCTSFKTASKTMNLKNFRSSYEEPKNSYEVYTKNPRTHLKFIWRTQEHYEDHAKESMNILKFIWITQELTQSYSTNF